MAVDESQHDDTERFLELGVFIQLVQDDIGVDVSTKFDDDAHPLAVRFIAKRRDAVDFLIAGQIGNGFNDPGLVDLVRDFRNDDAVLALIHRFDGSTRTHLDAATARRIGFEDAVAAIILAPVGKSGPLTLVMISSRLESGLSIS